MNKKQLLCLWTGVIAFAIFTIDRVYYVFSEPVYFRVPSQRDYWRIAVLIAVVTAALIYTFKTKKDKKPKTSKNNK